jgi:hypothetical protein
MTEMLFNRYFLQSFGLGQITLYAPSSREEYEKGYDAKLTSSQSFNEIFLQFKRPRVKADQFLLSTLPHQHTNLQKRPPNSCYYVGHTFRDLQEFERAQKEARASRDFLKYFVVIEISCLDPNLTMLVYERNEESLLPRTVSAIYTEGKTRISSKHYFTGTAFRDAFSRQEVGVHVSLTTEGELFEYARATQSDPTKANVDLHSGPLERPRQSWRPSPSIIRDMSAIGSQAEGKKENFGLLYRMPTK